MTETKRKLKKKATAPKKAKDVVVKDKKIDDKKIEQADKEHKLSRGYQMQFDNMGKHMVYKFNEFRCPACGFDINVVNLTIFTDPETRRKFLNLRKTCSNSCDVRDLLYELTPANAKKLRAEGVNLFNSES